MSRYFSAKYSALTPYTPGEQPSDQQYVKLNTNESPFPPSEKVMAELSAARPLNLYSDIECYELRQLLAQRYGVKPTEVLPTNGSDEILNFAFMAFCDEDHPAAFADITYGFYPVFAQLNRIPYREIPLTDDFSIDVNDYISLGKTIFIANPNAPTGKALPVAEIEKIISSNPDNVVIVDEAYVDFGGESCIPLIHKYKNLLVTQTFSKSRSMAGARLGYGIACEELMNDLNTIKYSTNPYNVNSMTLAAGVAMLKDDETSMANCRIIEDNRAYTVAALEELGFETLPSCTNFIFTRSDRISGEDLYLGLKEKGVLIRHFTKERIKDYNRVTIGTREQMDFFLDKVKELLDK